MSNGIVTIKVYVDMEVFCFILNCLNNSLPFNNHESKQVSLKKTRKFPYELQVPIQCVNGFMIKGKTNLNLDRLQRLNNGSYYINGH